MAGIIVRSDVIMPNAVLDAGVRGKQMRKNSRVSNQGGYVEAEIIWSTTLRQYEIAIAPMIAAACRAIDGLYEVTDAGAYGFLMEDPKDCTAESAGILKIGSTPGLFRTYKRYVSAGSSQYKDRLITRPMSTIVLLRNNSALPPSGAGSATIDPATGNVTFVADASRTVSSVVVGATTVLNLATALPGVVTGGQIYVSGLTGADAALLNGKYHTVTVAGTAYTIALNTTGKTITAGAGAAFQYPQPTDLLTWQGGFYVPVHFASDDIEWELVVAGDRAARYFTNSSIVLNEVREQ